MCSSDLKAMAEIKVAAVDPTINLLYPMKEAQKAGATVGEVADLLRGTWGTYRPSENF